MVIQSNDESGHGHSHSYSHDVDVTMNVELKSITPRDVVLETAEGARQPAMSADAEKEKERVQDNKKKKKKKKRGRQGGREVPPPPPPPRPPRPSEIHPLFPPLPTYGPPSLIRHIQCCAFRVSSFFLSLAFLGMIVVAATVTSLGLMCKHVWIRLLTFRNPDSRRPFYQEEVYRQRARKETEREWKRRKVRGRGRVVPDPEAEAVVEEEEFKPLEGGTDPIVCDVGYYARRVGLDVEKYKVQTEDGFVITLWHVYDPKGYTPAPESERGFRGPEVFTTPSCDSPCRNARSNGKKKYPVLLVHGLLQSAGAYCTTDDDSLAFFLCKSGYDVWLGDNRCGFHPEHTTMSYSDPRMWAWNIRQMGVFDLPAFVSRVLYETGFERLGLVCHSQGTTQALVAFSKGQRPDLGERISVFCGLAPAAYAGPLIGRVYFKFMRIITPTMFRLVFGIHAFIPFMMTMHALLPGHLYGALGYRVFSYLFDWTDERWDRGLRDRMFQFSPVYVSSESMRWWLGRKCFAKQKCILATKEEWRREETEDRSFVEDTAAGRGTAAAATLLNNNEPRAGDSEQSNNSEGEKSDESSSSDSQDPTTTVERRSASAWYSTQAPSFAFWVAGSDNLVDGRRLLRRFKNGREPHVRLVRAEVIDEYEHLDVIWAMDSIEKVGRGVRDVIWETVGGEVRGECCVPRGGNVGMGI